MIFTCEYLFWEFSPSLKVVLSDVFEKKKFRFLDFFKRYLLCNCSAFGLIIELVCLVIVLQILVESTSETSELAVDFEALL